MLHRRPLRISVFLPLCVLAACSSAPRGDQPASTSKSPAPSQQKSVLPSEQKAPAAEKPRPPTPATKPAATVESGAPSPTMEKKILCPPEPMPALKAGEFAVWIDSEPEGGIVVVDGLPVGRTPQRIVLQGTSRGFSREDVSIKVRFVATDAEHTSQTIEELLTPLDKLPARVRFTPQGATRVAR